MDIPQQGLKSGHSSESAGSQPLDDEQTPAFLLLAEQSIPFQLLNSDFCLFMIRSYFCGLHVTHCGPTKQ